MQEAKRLSFVVALKQYMGLKEGQTPTQFMQEYKELTQKDRNELYDALKAGGVDCEPPTGYSK